MAMTKAEKAQRHALRTDAALRWPTFDEPAKIDTAALRNAPYSKRMLAVGWWCNAYTQNVAQGCTDGTHHSNHSTEKTSTQGAGVFWPTELDALKALRWEMCRKYAADLAKIDERIEAARSHATAGE